MRPLRIAFVSSKNIRRFRRDGSFIYRCENLGLALSHLGHQVSLLHITALLIRRNFDIVVFLRPPRTWLFELIVGQLRRSDTVAIGDVDDLIFDPAIAQFRPSVRNQLKDQDKTWGKFVQYASALSKLDKLVVSTEELARRYRELHPNADCAVIPNAGHRSWRAISPSEVSSERNISYFCGTRTHDRDFSIVAPVLKRLLNRYPDLRIRIVGPLSVELQHPRVTRIPKVPFSEYPYLVRASHINIAPLEDTPFNQCKSALKALEGGMMNIPTIASPVGDYSRMNIQGVLHANSAEEWEAQLEFALEPENHRRLSEGLRDRILRFSDIDELAERFLHFAMQ